MLQPRMRIFLLYTGCLLEAVHDVSKNPGSHKADFSRNTAIRESGLVAAIRCTLPDGPQFPVRYRSSTASLNCSEFTSMYLCVVDICECPASAASNRTPTPLLAKRVIYVLRPELGAFCSKSRLLALALEQH